MFVSGKRAGFADLPGPELVLDPAGDPARSGACGFNHKLWSWSWSSITLAIPLVLELVLDHAGDPPGPGR